MVKTGKTLSVLSEKMSDYPQVLVNVIVSDKNATMEDERVKDAVKEAEKKEEEPFAKKEEKTEEEKTKRERSERKRNRHPDKVLIEITLNSLIRNWLVLPAHIAQEVQVL